MPTAEHRVARDPGLVVLKFGGSSVATPARLRDVARVIRAHRARHPRVVVVVSAMGDTTDELLALAASVSPHASGPAYRREMDMLLTTGERVSMSLLAMALRDLGVESLSFTGSQSGIVTDTVHGEARIAEIRPTRVREAIAAGQVAIVAGFQGVSRTKEITTLGRGGSDTSAVALAAALGAEECLIYTDVDGFFSADPRRVPAAKQLSRVGWDTALLAAHYGAQVLHPRCVELAWRDGLRLRVLSTMFDSENEKRDPSAVGHSGTVVMGDFAMNDQVKNLESAGVLTVAVQKGLARISATGAAVEGLHARLCEAGVKVLSWSVEQGLLHVLVEEERASEAEAYFSAANVKGLSVQRGLARLSGIGTGLMHAPQAHAAFLKAIRDAGLALTASSVSPVVMEALVPDQPAIEKALSAIHSALT